MSAAVRASSVGRLSRFGTGAQVVITVALALAAVLLVNWLVGRPGIRQRFDLTATSKHTLSTAMVGLLGRLEDQVKIEILYRPELGPRQQLDAEVMTRTEKLLALMETQAAGKLEIEVVDRTNVQAWEARRRELGIQGFPNGLVVSLGRRNALVPLDGRLAQFEEMRRGEQGWIPPRIMTFNAEESLAEAILDVTRGDTLHAYFTFGFGEFDALDSENEPGLGFLTDELKIDGFETHRWNYTEDGDLPDDCEVLAVVGPDRPWPEAMYAQVVDYVERGGRLVVAPHLDPAALRNSDVPDLLEHFGLEVSEGRLCHAVRDQYTGNIVDGLEYCEIHGIPAGLLPSHPLLQPFKAAGSTITIPMTHQVRVRSQPQGGLAQHLLLTAPNAWLDAAPIDRRFDQNVDGTLGQFPMAATVVAPPMQESETPGGLEAEVEIRVAAIGSSVAFTNAGIGRSPQFLRAVFNWVTDREHRITVPPRDPDLRFLPRTDDSAAFLKVTRFAQFYLPGAALLIGLFVWFRRTRAQGRRPAATSHDGATP